MKWISKDGYDWKGKWIWCDDEAQVGQWVSLRKNFSLMTVPHQVMARISVDSKYWMWINGKMVLFEGGVKTGENKTDMYYDYEDIASYLQVGLNTIAVLAVYFGKSSYGFKDSGQPGFFFDAEFPENSLTVGMRLVSDSSWKAIKHPAYETVTSGDPNPWNGVIPKPGDVANYRLSEPSIQYNARKEIKGWEMPEFYDMAWSSAKEIAQAGQAPYNGMIRRPIPQLKVEEIVKFTKDGRDGTRIWKEEVADASQNILYTIRNRTNIQGTPYLKIDAKEEEGKKIVIWTDAWYDINGVSVSHNYITKSGLQEWEAYGWMNGWDVYFEVPKDIKVVELGFRPSSYDTKAKGRFQTDDSQINRLYQMCYDTLLVTMRDTYMDCPTRERAQWWGDAVNEMQMACYAMDENAALLYKKTLNQTIHWTNEDGVLPTTASNPKDWFELPMQNLAGVHSFWQYYMYTGDQQPLKEGYDILLQYLKKWKLQQNGLVEHRFVEGVWDWMDWGENADAPVIENAWYYIAAKNMLCVAKELKKAQEDVDWLERRMSGIKHAFKPVFWKEECKAYYAQTDNQQPDDRANALAVYAGLADQREYEDIKTVLMTVKNASPYMEKYVLEALYMMGYDKDAMNRTKERFGKMLDYGYPTLWEFWNPEQGTKNHAWAGASLSMNYLFHIGIKPLTPAYNTFRVRPQMATLKEIQAMVPTPNGKIVANIYKNVDDTVKLSVCIPEKCKNAEICIPRCPGYETEVYLSNVCIYQKGKASLQNDSVKYKTEDACYIIFVAVSGIYEFTTKKKREEIL